MFRRSVDETENPAHRAQRGWYDLLQADRMQWLLRRETARADRTGRPFCLVLFRAPTSKRRSWTRHRIARELLRHARLTDEVGWYSDDYLAALLPDTPAAGARQFADRVAAAVARRVAAPASLVYAYPDPAIANPGSTDAPDPLAARINGNGNGHAYANGNGHAHANGNGRHNGHELSEKSDSHNGNGRLSVLTGRPQVALQSQASVAPASIHPGLSPASVQQLLVHPMPAWKRALDVVGAIVGLVVLFPLMALAALGIRLTSPGPIIFRQKRSGLGGKPFIIYKFRTMRVDAEARKQELRPLSEQDGPAFKLENDPRLTRLGRFLRKTSIDELPQLVNVLWGDMSLVGPRPLPCDEADACRPWQRRRLDVTPGLTCIWQVKGRSRVTFDEWVRMDVAYMRRRTLAHDLWLLLITIPAVLLRRGAR